VVAPEYSTKIIEKLTQFSPLRSLASVMTIGGTKSTFDADRQRRRRLVTGLRAASTEPTSPANIKVMTADTFRSASNCWKIRSSILRLSCGSNPQAVRQGEAPR